MQALKILVAEPQEVFRYGLRSILNHYPCWKVVAETATVKEALREIVRARPDVVILDFAMTDATGWEALAAASTKGRRLGLLILTDQLSPVSLQRALALGAQACVLKSEGAQELLIAIAAVGRGQTHLSPRVLEVMARSYTSLSGGSRRNAESLTLRQAQVLQLLAEGKTNKEVSAELGISRRTVETHRSQIMRRLDVHSITALVHYAIRNGFVSA